MNQRLFNTKSLPETMMTQIWCIYAPVGIDVFIVEPFVIKRKYVIHFYTIRRYLNIAYVVS